MSWWENLFGKTNAPAAAEEPVAMPETAEENAPETLPVNDFTSFFEGMPEIPKGHYSDNNKSPQQTQFWFQAEEAYKEKKYEAVRQLLFQYLQNKEKSNVTLSPTNPTDGSYFTLLQGSKKVYGLFKDGRVAAQVPLARLESAGIAAMRHVLELNFNLKHCHFSLTEDGTICLHLNIPEAAASPQKLYYGLRELAITADRQDDLLLSDYGKLASVDNRYFAEYPRELLARRYMYFCRWIDDMLAAIATLDADRFSGSISYQLLCLVYRLDFMFAPQGDFLSHLEGIHKTYWIPEGRNLLQRNALMTESILKLRAMPVANWMACVYASTDTFCRREPPANTTVDDSYTNARRDAAWYLENKHEQEALNLQEYGVLFNQFGYSMPAVMTNLATILLAVLHADYYHDLGLKDAFYNRKTKIFDKNKIMAACSAAIEEYAAKYPKMRWQHEELKWENLYVFADSFSSQMAKLDLSGK